MKTHLRRSLAVCGTVVFLGFAAAAPTLAQGGGVMSPEENARRLAEMQARQAVAAPTPQLSKKYPAWVGYLAIFVMIAGIIPLSLMPSKRTHQD